MFFIIFTIVEGKIVHHENILRIAKIDVGISGQYECIADNNVDAPLKTVVKVSVLGKKIERTRAF